MMDTNLFMTALRRRSSGLFGTKLSQKQQIGVNAILTEASRRRTPLNHLSYMLATTYHETGRAMSPNSENLNYTSSKRIREVWPSRFPTVASAKPFVQNPKGLANKVYNGRMGNRTGSDDGWNYRGRGMPHLTGRDNYAKATKVTGIDLINNPDRALEIHIAVKILFDGMTDGWFTGSKLSSHLTPTKTDYHNARRVVNGVDEATKIKGYAVAFESALKEAGYEEGVPVPVPKPQPPGQPDAEFLSTGSEGALVTALQQELKRLKYHSGGIDGIYGNLTRDAVLAFQADNGLDTDGIVGPQVWTALEAAKPRPLMQERETATVDELAEKGSEIADASKKNKKGAIATFFAGVGGMVAAAGERVGDLVYLGPVFEQVKPFFEQYGVWLFGTAFLFLTGFIWYQSRRSGQARLRDHQDAKTL